MLRRLTLAFAALWLGLLLAGGTASAASCTNDEAHIGQLPTCTYDENGKLIDKTYRTDGGGGSMPGAFVGFFIIALIVTVGGVVWRVSTARDIARRAGMDPDDATAAALLTDNGLDATYLAASLRGTQQQQHVPPPRTAESRLEELKSLLDQGLINQTEYDERRTAILAEI